MQALGLHVEHRAHTGAGAPAGLLDQEADRVALVEQAQPAGFGRVLAVARVQEDAAAHQDAVGLGDQRGDPAHVEVGAARAGAAGQAFVHVAAHGLFPEARVGGVDGELARGLGHADVGVGEVELADDRVEGEAGDAVADRQHQHRRWAVDGVAGGDLLAAGLQELRGLGILARARRAQHREDRTHRHVDVDVGRAIERIEREQVLAALVARRERDRRLVLLRDHAGELAAPVRGAQEDLVGEHVELLLFLALHVGAAVAAEHVGERAVGDRARDRLAGLGDLQDEGVELAGGLGVAAAVFDQVFGERAAVEAEHGVSPPGGAGLAPVVVRCRYGCGASVALSRPRPAGSGGWRARRIR